MSKKRFLDNKWMALASLVILVTLLRLPSLAEPFERDSGSFAYHARLIYRGEPLYSTHHPSHHLPGVYYTYAVAFSLLGDSTWSVKVLLIPWTVLTAYLIFLIGCRLGSKSTGFLGAVFYSILNSHILLKGTTGEPEIFANLPIAAAILLAIDFTLQNRKNWYFFFIGFLCAVAVLYKFVFITPVLVTVLVVLAYAWSLRENQKVWKNAVIRILWLTTGFLSSLLLVVLIYLKMDLLPRFLLVFTVGFGYVDQLTQGVSPLGIIIIPLYILIINNVILVLLSLKGIIRFIKYKKMVGVDQKFKIAGFAIVMWYLFSILVAGTTRKGWPHYSLIVIPSLSILAAWEIGQIHQSWISREKSAKRSPFIEPAIFFIIISIFISALLNLKSYTHYVSYKLGYETYEDFIGKGFISDGANHVKLNKISKYIKSHTSPEDFIYSWSDDAQIYYLTDRRPPIDDMTWADYAEATGSLRRIFSPRTKYIIVGNSILIPKPEWLAQELDQSYILETIIDDQFIYRRKNH